MVGAPIPDSIRRGRRVLDGIQGYRLKQDFNWDPEANRWYLLCTLTTDQHDGALLPQSTDWCVVVEDRYPDGDVRIYPATDGGITTTFPHQRYNEVPHRERAWKTGQICVTTPDSVLGRLSNPAEPYTVDERLAWNIERALLWISLASAGSLPMQDEPYEIPDFPTRANVRFAFDEDRSTASDFIGRSDRTGYVDLVTIDAGPMLVRRFKTKTLTTIRDIPWSASIGGLAPTEGEVGIWMFLDSPPLVGPWEVPIRWGDLESASAALGLSFEDEVQPLFDRLRDGRAHLLLIGFPVPDTNGGEPVQLHWQALRLPVLSNPRAKVPDGFRANSLGWQSSDRRSVLSPSAPLDWADSENWSRANTHARGRYGDGLSGKTVALIGAGALGSAIAEMLVRGGLQRLVVCDPELFAHGNLARHTLTMSDEGQFKAVALSARLRQLSPHLDVEAVTAKFPQLMASQSQIISGCDLIIDCTAERDTLAAIEHFEWNSSTYIVSMAFGWYVQRVYIIGAPLANFTQQAVEDILSPLIEADLQAHPDSEQDREGPGCWDLIFPGRIDDVWMMAAAAARELERFVEDAAPVLRATMLEWASASSFEGITRRVVK